MKLYADGSAHRARQVTADVLVVVWVLVWVRVGRAVRPKSVPGTSQVPALRRCLRRRAAGGIGWWSAMM